MPSCSTPLPAARGIVLRAVQLLLFCACLALLPQPAAASDNLKSLFNFQTKMASHGNSEAMIKLGEMYEEGLGTEKNEDHAREWYQRALKKGHPDAQSHLDKLKQKQEKSARDKAVK